jgi:hypothetical protein
MMAKWDLYHVIEYYIDVIYKYDPENYLFSCTGISYVVNNCMKKNK